MGWPVRFCRDGPFFERKEDMKGNRNKKGFLALALAVCMAVPTQMAFAQTPSTTIQILHTNDIHGTAQTDEDGAIGFAKLKTLAKESGADLVLDVGDTFHGQTFATLTEGASIATLMGQVGYDAMTPGNHDWSYGAQQLKTLEETGGFPILAANVVDEGGEAFFETPYLVKEVTAEDGTTVKVGVLGVIDDAFYTSTPSKNVAGLSFAEEAKTATALAATLRQEEGCDLVIAITHQADCASFVAATKGIDLVLAGHEHLVFDTTYPDAEGKDVFVAESGSHFLQAGVVEVTLTKEKEVAEVTETVYDQAALADMAEDEGVSQTLSALEKSQEEQLLMPVGTVAQDCPYSWEEIRISQQEIGRLVTESYLTATGADVALENAGGIRGGLTKGTVTYGDVIAVSPYGNGLVTKQISGSDLLEVLEQSFAIGAVCDAVYTLQKEAVAQGEDPYQYAWPDNSGSYLQFAVITAGWSEEAGLTDVLVGGQALAPEQRYTVATNEYVAESEDFPALAAAPVEKEFGTCLEALLDQVAQGKEVDPAVSRGEAAQMLITAALPIRPQVQQSDILQGYGNGERLEEQPVTGTEVLAMLARAFGPLPQKKEALTKQEETVLEEAPVWAKEALKEVFLSDLGVEEVAEMAKAKTMTAAQLHSLMEAACAQASAAEADAAA